MPEQIDVAQQWKAFTPERRTALLAKMSPEQKKSLRSKIEGGNAPPPTVAPSNRFNRTVDEGVRGFGRGLLNIGEGLIGPELQAAHNIRHPIQSALDQAAQDQAGGEAIQRAYQESAAGTIPQRVAATTLGVLENAPMIGGMVQHVEQGGTQLASPEGVGAAVEGLTTFLAPEVAGRGLSAVGKLRRTARGFVQENLDAGHEFAKKTVDKYGKESQDVKAANKRATEKTLESRGKVEEGNQKADFEHAKRQSLVAQKNARATAEHEAKARDVEKHNATVAKAAEDEKALHGQIDTHAKELDTRIQQAKVKAKAANDTQWRTVRAKVGDASVPAEDLAGDVKAAEDKLKGSKESIKVFRDILSRQGEEAPTLHFDGKPVEAGSDLYNRTRAIYQEEGLPTGEEAKPVTFSDLHGYYSELGERLSSGNLEGDVYQAMKALQERVGKRMQALADEKGAGEDLTQARQGFRNYQEAFSDSPATKQTVASKVLSETVPDYVKARDQEARLGKVAAYDPEIGNIAGRVRDAHGKLKDLPKGEPKPVPYPPEPEPGPEPPVSHQYGEPNATTPEAEAPDLTAERREMLGNKLRKYGKWGSWVGRILLGGTTAALLHGDLPTKLGTDLLFGQGAMTILSEVMRRDKVLDWLAKPSPKDLELIDSLPPAERAKMREALTGLAQAELRQNPSLAKAYKIAPGLISFMGFASIPSPVANRKDAMAKVAPTPGTHVFSVKDWKSHPENRGKDVNLAIQKAKQQGYPVVQ